MIIKTGVLAICNLPDEPVAMQIMTDYFLVLTKEVELFCFELKTQHWRRLGEYPELLCGEELDKITYSIYPAPNRPWAAVVQDRGQWGLVVDCENGEVKLRMNRGDYHPEQTRFPFVWHGDFLVHAVEWNELVVSHIEGMAIAYTPHQDLPDFDYFVGSLQLSPQAKWLSCNGWHWGPYPALYFLPFKTASVALMKGLVNKDRKGFWALSSYWERAMAWVDEERLLLWYNPKEDEDPVHENERCQAWGITAELPYVLEWSVEKETALRFFEMDHLAVSEYGEPIGARFELKDQYLLVFCVKNGLAVYDWKKGKHLATFVQTQMPDIFDIENLTFYKYIDNKVIIYNLQDE